MTPKFRSIHAAVVLSLLAAVLGSCGKDKKKERDREEEREEEERADERRIARKHVNEAKNALGAIARGAVGAYERETTADGLLEGDEAAAFVHSLCKSAQPVPAEVPKGTKHQPSSDAGKDFETGDAKTGWKCLRFSITNPIRYRYEYRAGGNYKGPARGGIDPGPSGFEISAEGDLDGDGKTSLIIQTGVVNETTKTVRLATELFIVDELE